MPEIGCVLVDTTGVDPAGLQDRFNQASDLILSLTALSELLFGALKSKRPMMLLSELSEFRSTCIVVLPDEETALEYSRIRHELMLVGNPIPENAIWIAAIARQHALPLAMRDRHFATVPGLQLLD